MEATTDTFPHTLRVPLLDWEVYPSGTVPSMPPLSGAVVQYYFWFTVTYWADALWTNLSISLPSSAGHEGLPPLEVKYGWGRGIAVTQWAIWGLGHLLMQLTCAFLALLMPYTESATFILWCLGWAHSILWLDGSDSSWWVVLGFVVTWWHNSGTTRI